MAQKVWWERTADFHRATLWFLPAVAVGVALALGSLLTRFDIDEESFLGELIFRGDVGEARELLTVIASTMITVTGLVFVLTVVALQIASTQFSPRLLRTFMRDRGTQIVLSTFVATFAYSLAGLHNVGRSTSTGEPFLPRLAITGALVLAFASVGMLVFYIQHISNSIRIDTIMQRVEDRTLAALNALRPAAVVGTSQPVSFPDPIPRCGSNHRLPVRLCAGLLHRGAAWPRRNPQRDDDPGLPGRPSRRCGKAGGPGVDARRNGKFCSGVAGGLERETWPTSLRPSTRRVGSTQTPSGFHENTDSRSRRTRLTGEPP